MSSDIASRELSDRVVLLCLADLQVTGSTPAHTGEVIRAAKDCLDAIEADTLGKLSEAEVNRTINSLEDAGLVEMDDSGETSPAGKGRPAYTLVPEPDAVVGTLSDDDEVGTLAERVDRREG